MFLLGEMVTGGLEVYSLLSVYTDIVSAGELPCSQTTPWERYIRSSIHSHRSFVA